jgi:transporter family protein
VFAKFSTGRLGVTRIAILILIVEGSLYSLAFLFWREPVRITLGDGLLAGMSCMIGITGYLCYFESIMDGQVSIAGTISAAYPALAVIGAVLLLSETMSFVQTLGVIAIIAGIVGLSYEWDSPGSKALTRRSLFFSLAAFITWGVWSLTSKMAIDEVGAGNIFAFYALAALTVPPAYALIRRTYSPSLRGTDPSRLAWTFGAVALGINVVGAWVFSFALQDGNASLVIPISTAYPIVTVVLAVLILKEKVSRPQAGALFAVLAGLIAIGLTV